jgi:N-terminal acetyltransferase B complex non-catalytic subunit
MVALSVSESKVKQTAAHIRLSHLKNVASLMKKNVGEDPNGSGAFTVPERLFVQIGLLLIDFLTLACDPDLSSQEKVSKDAAKLGAEFSQFVSEFMVFIENCMETKEEPDYDWMPMFMTTTHPLYTAHEAGTLTVAVANYLCKAAVWVNPDVKRSAELCLKEFGQMLRNLVCKKARMVMRWINGPRLDRVLEQIQSEHPGNDKAPSEKDTVLDEEAFELANGYKRNLLPDAPQTFGTLLTECFSPDFLENWASELVDSWRESVLGLACLKADIKESKANAA